MKTCDHIQLFTPEDQCKISVQFINPRNALLPDCPGYSHQWRHWRTTVGQRTYTGTTDIHQEAALHGCSGYRGGNKQDLSIFRCLLGDNETILQKGGKHLRIIFGCCLCVIYQIQCYSLYPDIKLRIWSRYSSV